MIKRYILHIETHWRHLPRISFRRAPRPGDRVKDGGVWGTLRRCPTCQEGFLHEPDPRPKRPKPMPSPSFLTVFIEALARNAHQPRPYPTRPPRSYHTPRPAMDLNAPRHVDLKLTEPTPEPVEHVELKVDEPVEHVELKTEDESPETLELGYALGTIDHKHGDILWTHKAEYVVDKLEDDVLYLVRKDVWDAREKKAKKKAKHVELKVDEPGEHVELKDEDEKPAEIVQLKFD